MAISIFKLKTGTGIKKMSLIFSIAVLAACTSPAPVTFASAEQIPYVFVPRTYVSISCVEHEGVPYIYDFSIQEPIARGPLGAGVVQGSSCGGIIAAGYALPDTWYPGMKVKVRWKPNGRDYVEKITNIMRYDEPGTIYVHFFKDDQVRVVAAAFNGPGNPRHPISMRLKEPPPEDQ